MSEKKPNNLAEWLDFTNWPKNYRIAAIVALMVILLAVTLWSWGGYSFKDNTDYQARQKESELLRQQYQAVLAAINVDPKDSEVVLKKIATEDIVKEDLYQALQIGQPITIPEIKNSEINIASASDKNAVEGYLTKTVAMVEDYNSKTSLTNQLVFTGLQDKTLVDNAVEQTTALANNLRKTSVPSDMVEYHKAKIAAYEQYADFLSAAKSYTPGDYDFTTPEGNQWPTVYKDYAVINNRAEVIGSELRRVDQKFALSESGFKLAGESPEPVDPPLLAELGLIKQSQAFLGFGDLTITIGDIPRLILYGMEQGLARAFTTIIMSAVDRIVAKIDKYFTITSQLYYSQELGKLYTKEYWTKLKTSDVDQQIMKNFLPQYFCAPQSTQDLQKLGQVFKAKSQQLLNYDISTIPLDSPNYYEALNDLGEKSNALVDPWSYWQDIYTAQAGAAGAAAADAVNKEITGTGVKSGRNLLNNAIAQNVNKILGVQEGSVTQALNLGNSKADSIISTLIAGVFESITTKFIFTAVSSGQRGGSLSTVEEQPICISTPKVKPVIPSGATKQELEKIDQEKVQSCRTFMQLYNEAKQAGATGLNEDVAKECQDLIAKAGG